MYGEWFEIEGQKVFILCSGPDAPYVEKVRLAKRELALMAVQEEAPDMANYDLVERQYAAGKTAAEKLTPSEIDVKLSMYGVNGILRDEILERLSELAKFRAETETEK